MLHSIVPQLLRLLALFKAKFPLVICMQNILNIQTYSHTNINNFEINILKVCNAIIKCCKINITTVNVIEVKWGIENIYNTLPWVSI